MNLACVFLIGLIVRRFNCTCGNSVFFENNQCVACSSELGWCPVCAAIGPIIRESNGGYRCGHQTCGVALTKCYNYAHENVCNRCVVTSHDVGGHTLCDYCRFNETIPDLSVKDNRKKWLRLERGKRRLLYTLDLLRLPYGDDRDGIESKLSFDFKDDVAPERKWLWVMSKGEQVYTGHANGKITINLREADHVEREKARVSFNEAHRTVIGHFRHEIGHYYWDLLVKSQCEADCIAIFGDHDNPNYSEALEKYYKEGPAPGWEQSFVSNYATMHSWEDFAETFATYLDMISVLDTAFNMGFLMDMDVTSADFKTMTDQYARLGVLFNEVNRSMGLLDLVPEILAPRIMEKMSFVHDLLRKNQKSLRA